MVLERFTEFGRRYSEISHHYLSAQKIAQWRKETTDNLIARPLPDPKKEKKVNQTGEAASENLGRLGFLLGGP